MNFLSFFLMSFFLVLLSTSPLTMSLSMVLFSFLVAWMAGLILTKWLFYAVVLVFLGGMMVMFLYASSLSFNEKIFFRKSFFLFLFLMTMFLFIFPDQSFLWPSFLGLTEMKMIYHSSWVALIMLYIFYLTVVLLQTVKVTSSFKGAISKIW